MSLTILFVLSFATYASCDFGLINLLYWKADANLDHVISKAELQAIWHDFDKNNDKKVTQAEYLPLWMEVTGQSRENAVAYFLLADLNDDEIIDQTDIDALYRLFDQDGSGQVSAAEFSSYWQKIILDMPFAVMFEHADVNHDEFLSDVEFTKAFFYLDSNHDNQLMEHEFTTQWLHHGFGAAHQGEEFFKKLDANRDGVVNAADLSQFFIKYDTSGDHKLSLMEFIKMSSMVPAIISRRSVRTSEIQYEVALFDAVDIDKNHFLDKAELNTLFFSFDNNNDSRVTEEEFVTDWTQIMKLGSAQQARTLFNRADSTGDGVITSDDLVYIFQYFDQNGDAKIGTNEFLDRWSALQLGPVDTGTIVG